MSQRPTKSETKSRVVGVLKRTLRKTIDDFPLWIRFAVTAGEQFATPTLADRSGSKELLEKLSATLDSGERERLSDLRAWFFEKLLEDRLENGGWGISNNRVLGHYFDGVPNDFDTEGSMTLTRWVLDAVRHSSLSSNEQDAFFDDRLAAYLDSRVNHAIPASGRLTQQNQIGQLEVHTSTRHTAASILCYVSMDASLYHHSARAQVNYLLDKFEVETRNPNEVGHPDIVRALAIASSCLYDQDDPTVLEIVDVATKWLAFTWRWLTNPQTLNASFGPKAGRYLRVYSLASLSDLYVLPWVRECSRPFGQFRRMMENEITAAARQQSDPLTWGLAALMLWSHLAAPEKDADPAALRRLLDIAVRPENPFADGFCVYWAVMFSILDALLIREAT